MSAWTDGQHLLQEKQKKNEESKNPVEDKYDGEKSLTEICREDVWRLVDIHRDGY